ncbi:MAG: EAL domain-containing protein, partial [Acidobacteriota bacterium]
SYQASHDALTGLLNRYELENRLKRLLLDARERQRTHALCYLDLDQFKIINERCGHVAGDELLRQLAAVLREEILERDAGVAVSEQPTVARLGGDEFGVLLEGYSVIEATRIAETLLRRIEDFRFLWQGRRFAVSVSVGLVPIDATSDSASGLLRAADSACYAAKDDGRNRVHVYRIDDAELVRRSGEMRWVNRIRRALEDDRFYLDYQPIVGIRQGSRVARPQVGGPQARQPQGFVEFLLRMEDEAGERIPPDRFMPAAERYQLASQLDQWVVSSAFDWMRQHPQQLPLCSINLSGQSLGDLDFLRFVLQRIEATGVPPSNVCFEITETAAIANLAQATHFIKTLRALGCRFSLDDFGTGFSSFAYLKQLPVDFLKIDGMFVRDASDDRFDLAVIRSIVRIAGVLGKRTVAECVEDARVLRRLETIGVDYAQGDGIRPPQPLEAYESSEPAVSPELGGLQPSGSQLSLPF